MADAYSRWIDKMTLPNFGALNVLDVKLQLKVPDGSWFIVAKMDLDNDSSSWQTVDCRLRAGVDEDRNVVRLAPSGEKSVDMACLAFTVIHHFEGKRTQRVNEIFLGHMNPAQPSQIPHVSAGRAKITAIKVGSFVNEPSG